MHEHASLANRQPEDKGRLYLHKYYHHGTFYLDEQSNVYKRICWAHTWGLLRQDGPTQSCRWMALVVLVVPTTHTFTANYTHWTTHISQTRTPVSLRAPACKSAVSIPIFMPKRAELDRNLKDHLKRSSLLVNSIKQSYLQFLLQLNHQLSCLPCLSSLKQKKRRNKRRKVWTRKWISLMIQKWASLTYTCTLAYT